MWGLGTSPSGVGDKQCPCLTRWDSVQYIPTMVKNDELTTTQKEALRTYQKFETKHGVPPSVRQLAAELDISHNASHYLIGMLRDKGFLAPRAVTEMRLKVSAKGKKAL